MLLKYCHVKEDSVFGVEEGRKTGDVWLVEGVGGDSDPVLGFFLPTIVVSSPHKIGGGYDRRELAKIGTNQESRF